MQRGGLGPVSPYTTQVTLTGGCMGGAKSLGVRNTIFQPTGGNSHISVFSTDGLLPAGDSAKRRNSLDPLIVSIVFPMVTKPTKFKGEGRDEVGGRDERDAQLCQRCGRYLIEAPSRSRLRSRHSFHLSSPNNSPTEATAQVHSRLLLFKSLQQRPATERTTVPVTEWDARGAVLKGLVCGLVDAVSEVFVPPRCHDFGAGSFVVPVTCACSVTS